MKMNSPEQSLSHQKAKTDARYKAYLQLFEKHIKELRLEEQHFNNITKQDIINGTARLLSGYDISPQICNDYRKCLLLFGITSMWYQTSSIKEKKDLLNILKILAVNEDEKDYDTISGKVKLLTSRLNPRGYNYDPNAYKRTRKKRQSIFHEEYDQLLKRIKGAINQKASKQLEKELRSIEQPSAILAHVRETLGIKPQTEKPYNVLVLNYNAETMAELLNVYGIYFPDFDNNGPAIVLSKDYFIYEDTQTIEHEYAHSQGDGLNNIGFMCLIWQGLNEAITECVTSYAVVYAEEREFFGFLLDQVPELKTIIISAYMGDKAAVLQFYKTLVQNFGVIGLLYCARAYEYTEDNNEVEQSVFIKTQTAMDNLKKLSADMKSKKRKQAGFLGRWLG